MDRQALGALIPVMVVFLAGMVGLSRTVVGRALVRRIGGEVDGQTGLTAELRELRPEVQSLRGGVAWAHERLEVAHRLLTTGRMGG